LTSGSNDFDDVTMNEMSYADAMGELEALLDELDRDDVDIDALAAKVRRAAEIITLCRERITAVEMEIEQIVVDLDGGSTPSDP
jgi:exodeoxyribonuclease VII small subunit